MAIRQVLWDWNGTLLDDLDYSIGVRNRVFPDFGLPPIRSLDEYHEQFSFPIRLYYERAGVTDANFVAVANAWMGEYMRGCAGVPLHSDAIPTLKRFKAAGLQQVILTASALPLIQKQLSYYPLEGFFVETLGLDNIFAHSKEAVGQAYIARSGFAPAESLMLGDTLHDAEVACAMGARCALVARGHQSAETLQRAGVPVFGTLAEAADWALGI